jgi:D-3-phosphoglycerate dehydrogenase
MSRDLVLVTNRFDDELRARLPQIPEADFRYVKSVTEDEGLLGQASALVIRTGCIIDKDFLKKAPNLKFIVTATSGFDHIDLQAIKGTSVRVFHIPEAQTTAAAELTISMIFNCARKWSLAQKQLYKGEWERSLLLGRQISGMQWGIIGLGRVGQAVAQRASALGMTVYAYDPYLEEPVDGVTMLGYEELMRTCDGVSLHVPKTKETFQMIKKDTLAWMNTSGILVNMSRGDVINETDLVEHLLQNPEFIAGLDVYAKEPLAVKSRLLELSNVCLTPHIGASTQEALKTASKTAIEKVVELLQGGTPSGELPPRCLWWQDE